jgi:SAM-dependent methyltransferase
VEIGGGLSGFQFVCAKTVEKYINVDPFADYGATDAYGSNIDSLFATLNRQYGTNVVLIKSPLAEANIAPKSVDLVYSISVIEHLNEEDLEKTLNSIQIILKPGGLFVATVDLFLNLRPFTSRKTNQWGTNISIAPLVGASGLNLIEGNRSELFGYPEFDPDFVLSHLEEYFVGDPYPCLVQAFILGSHRYDCAR